MTGTGVSRQSRPRTRVRCATVAFLAVTCVSTAVPATAAGPWRAQVVDADTDQPLPDVVVVGAWTLRTPGPVHEGASFHAADEVVSDGTGRFVLPAQRGSSRIPFTRLSGPQIWMLKGGYGGWRFRLPPRIDANDAVVRDRLVKEAWLRFETDGVTIELLPARSREERLQALRRNEIFVSVPPCHVPRWLSAFNAERRALGLTPFPTVAPC